MTEPAAPDDLAARPFDELVAELQRIVQALEAGNLPLEESIARYREALRLHAAAELRLREAELTISELGRGMGAEAGRRAGATEGDGLSRWPTRSRLRPPRPGGRSGPRRTGGGARLPDRAPRRCSGGSPRCTRPTRR